MAGLLGLVTSDICEASDCNCGPKAHHPVMMAQAPFEQVAALTESGCACSAAVSACCGSTGGVMQLSNLYGAGTYGTAGGAFLSGPAPGSFLSGYEGLPNMDGGGIHHRYPYHSYRRPWAHPGTPSTNVTIVW